MAQEDSLDTDITRVNAERKAPLDADLDAQLDALIASQGQPQATPAASPTVSRPVPVALTPQSSSSPSVMGETARAVGGAVRDAAQNTLDLSTDITNWTRENLLGLRATEGFKLPEVAENQTTTGKVGRSLIQFVVPFMGYAKALRGLGVANTVVRGMAAGAVTDATAFDPHEKRLSNMVMEMSDSNPVMGKAMFDYLSAHPEDTNAEGRFKNAVEGLGLGVAVEGVFKGMRMVKHHYFTKGEDPAASVRKAAEEAKKEMPVESTTPEVEVPGDAAPVTATGTPPAAPKVAKGAKPEKAGTPPVEPVKAPEVTIPETLKRPEVAGIAPREVLAGIPKRMPVIKQAQVSQIVKAALSEDYASVTQALKESDFNFAHVESREDIQGLMDAVSSVVEKEINTAKHGVETFGQTKELAEELGAGTATMKEMYGDTNQLSAKVLSHRMLLAASADTVTSLARLARTGDVDAMLALRKHVTLHASMQAQMKGIQTEIARALSSFRITAKSVDLSINERNELIEAMGGHKLNVEFAQKLAGISDPKKLHAVIRRGAMARTKDAIFEAWINGLLSAPATHVVNTVGNTLTALASVAERGTAAAIGKVLRTGDDSIQAGEVKAQLFGMMEGLKDAISITSEGLAAVRKAAGQAATGNLKGAGSTLDENLSELGGAWEAAVTNAPVLDNAAFSTMEHGARGEAITASQFDLDPNSIIGGFVDGLGALVRLPGRALMTSDELFKTIHYRGELKAQAYRDGRTKGLTGDELFSHVARMVEDPTPALQAQALNAARQGTFTTPLGTIGSSGQHYLNQVPGARYVMPFVRTPVNIMKYVGVRTPGLNLLAESVRNEFKAGGVRRDVMLAKTALGGSLYALGATLAAEGVITGGGEKDQSAERLGGIQPYSVKVGNTYYAYNRLDPFGMFLGMAADISDISGHIGTDKADEMASVAALAISRNLVSKQYLSGIVEFLDTINSGSETRWQSFIKKFSSTFVPFSALSGAIRREVDPEVKEAWTVMDAVKSKLPGFSKDVPPLVNIFGEDVHYKGGLGPDIASPVYTSEVSTDPAATEIARLNIDLRHPPRVIQAISGGPGIDLDHKQYYKYMKLIGQGDKGDNGFKQEMLKLVQSSRYQNLPEDPDNNLYVEAKEKTIRLLFDAHKKRATMQLIQGDPQLQAAFKQNLRNAGNALTGKPVLKFQ